MLTLNEKKVLRTLFAFCHEELSINRIAKECSLAPNGAFKILKKLEKENIIKPKQIANIKAYRINFEEEKTKNILPLALSQDLNEKLKFRLEDLKPLKDICEACIVFGSYPHKKEANDLDILFILNPEKLKKYKEKSPEVFKIIPIKVHDMLQTPEDLTENIKNNNEVILDILKKGIILWGFDKIIEVMKNGCKK